MGMAVNQQLIRLSAIIPANSTVNAPLMELSLELFSHQCERWYLDV